MQKSRNRELQTESSTSFNVFNQIPPQLAKENKKFQISKVASGARFKDYRGCNAVALDFPIIDPQRGPAANYVKAAVDGEKFQRGGDVRELLELV